MDTNFNYMYEYNFVRVKPDKSSKSSFGGLFFKSEVDTDYHSIILNYATQGWRLKQIFSPPVQNYGTSPYIELIFERKILKNKKVMF